MEIKGEIRNGSIIFTVSDNGIGMSREKLEKVVSSMMSADHAEFGYGLYNVESRIRLLFGKNYGISIDSEENAGTDVVVRIPPVSGEPE